MPDFEVHSDDFVAASGAFQTLQGKVEAALGTFRGASALSGDAFGYSAGDMPAQYDKARTGTVQGLGQMGSSYTAMNQAFAGVARLIAATETALTKAATTNGG